MSRILIFILMFVLFGIVGCSDTADIMPHLQDNTKVEIYTPHSGNSPNLYFEPGEEIGIYPVCYVNENAGVLGNTSNPMNIRFTNTQTGWVPALGEEIYLEPNEMVDIYAYSPYDAEMSSKPGKLNLGAYPFDVSGDQNNKENDFLWTKTQTSQQSPIVGLEFEHLMSRIEINLNILDTNDVVQGIRLYNILTYCTINLRTGEVTTENKSEIISPTVLSEPTMGYIQTYEALFPPQAIASGAPLFIVEYQESELIYYLSEAIEFNASYNYRFNLNIDESLFQSLKVFGQALTPELTDRT